MARRLPSLTALKAFEAAARHQSFTRAADELFVTQAAVSRQIRELEEALDRPLFHRLHRRVELTEAGATLAAATTRAFEGIEAALAQIGRAAPESLLPISVEPPFAMQWLLPRLGRFNALHPEIDVVLDPDFAIVDLAGSGTELAIRYSDDQSSWLGSTSHPLAEIWGAPVLAPRLLAQGPPLEGPADLVHYTLLHEEDREYWARWFRDAGLPDQAVRRGPVFKDATLAIEAAVLGQGVVLGDPILTGDDVAAGRLVQPLPQSSCFGAYWLVTPEDGPQSDGAAAFARWLLDEMAAFRAARGIALPA
ncbi:LysR family transcriptional regulator [Aliidongia dinghuensis]|uniref:LysR family transcriptional regulator n=1 Tax=Aliidongia dinghuensis TaxID=1867774 RepID=A0A8J3E3J5_9PROT|nr:transcriptional regulator GcvA [Aliidongia dinghuensis]GGF07049.1 LysR family transcriptional regulator [Aliidongia dinghuensis]